MSLCSARNSPISVKSRLINVAGILSNNKAFETSAAEWRKVHAVNYDSAFYLSKACMPHMVEQGWGRVVNLSSWAWKSGGLTAGTAYSASKAAVIGLTFSLARQFALHPPRPCAHHGVRLHISLPLPGILDTRECLRCFN